MAELSEIRAWCEQARPLFICGLARSGTSMLQVAFARHAEMYNIKNCRETHIFVRPRTAIDDPVHVPTKLYLKSRENLMGYRKLVKALEKKQKAALSEEDLIRVFFWYASTTVYGLPGPPTAGKNPRPPETAGAGLQAVPAGQGGGVQP